MKNRKVPEIRFSGFEGEWEEKTLGELSEIVRGASPRPIQDEKWFDSSSEIGWLRISDVTKQNGRIHFLEQRLSKEGQEKTRVLKEPYLLLSIAATVGKPVINYVKTGVHDGFLIFKNPKFHKEFMFQWLEMFREKWKKYGQPGSQVNLNSDLVKRQEIKIPSNNEQEKIGSFFLELEKRISLYKEELFRIEKTKQGFLEKMFPKEGEKVPEIRFPEFTGEWKEMKLKSAILSELKGKAKAEMIGEENVYLETNYLNGGKPSFVNSKIDVWEDDVLVLWDGSQAGTVYHGFKGALGSTLKAYKPKDSGEFLYQFLKRHQNNIYKNYRTPNIPHVIKSFTNEFYILIPNVDEQEKIGLFFKNLDNTITLHQRQLTLLQNTKKAFLQKMFP